MAKLMLTGIRPTGLLHLGHYMGALKSYIELQPNNDSFFVVSDMHMLTTRCSKKDILTIYDNARNMVIDCIGMGIDPENTTFYLQSNVPELAYIFLLVQNFITVGRAKITPSLGEMSRHIGIDNIPMGLLAYPVLESGDILSLEAEIVPVGKDNIDHIAMAREITDRINNAYDADFKMPECISGENNYIPGLDGLEKMSKSLNNTIFMRDSESEVDKKISQIPWIKPESKTTVNVVMEYLKIFEPDKAAVRYLTEGYFDGQDVEKAAKEQLKSAMNNILEPVRKRIKEYDINSDYIDELLKSGTLKAREKVCFTLKKLKKCMGMFDFAE